MWMCDYVYCVITAHYGFATKFGQQTGFASDLWATSHALLDSLGMELEFYFLLPSVLVSQIWQTALIKLAVLHPNFIYYVFCCSVIKVWQLIKLYFWYFSTDRLFIFISSFGI